MIILQNLSGVEIEDVKMPLKHTEDFKNTI